MKDKIKSIFVMIVIMAVGINFLSFHYGTKEPKETKNSFLSIMLEDEEGKYVKAKENTWSEEYILNDEKSYCTNNSKLSYNEETKKVSLTTKGSEKCWLYFDKEITGTEDNPYKIATIEDLVDLSNEVNQGNNYAGKYIVLTKDLDFKNREDYENPDRIDYGNINGVNGIETLYNELNNPDGSGFTPIGLYGTRTFQGTFDGLNNTIENLQIINAKENMAIGFFGAINNAIVKNLKITGTIETIKNANTGGIAGDIANSIIENCHNLVNITSQVGSFSVGGIVGVGEGTSSISNSTNESSLNGSNNIGGIIGYNGGTLTIDNCSNNGDITNNIGEYLGGILGRDNASTNNTNIINSNNYGKLTINSEKQTGCIYIGGLVGRVYGTLNIQNSNNKDSSKTMELELKGDVWPYMGGLIGMGDGAKISIDNALNEQPLKVTNNGTKDLKIAGILSYIKNSGSFEINNVQNTGNMEINDKSNAVLYISGILGLIGSNSTTIMTKVKNTSEEIRLNSNNNQMNALNIGGIIGSIDTNVTAKITDSYNTANVYGGTKFGGIVAWSLNKSTLLIDKCYNSGNFETSDTATTSAINIGGLVGYSSYGSSSYIVNSYNIGDLKNNVDSTGADLGGIIGDVFSNATSGSIHNYIINSYNLGNIDGTTNNSVSGIFNDYTANDVVNELYINNVYNAGSLIGTTKAGLGNLSSTANYIINNAYYENSVSASNVAGVEGTAMALTAMKSQNFVDTLNNNLATINLGTTLKEIITSGLVGWKLGSDNIPTFDEGKVYFPFTGNYQEFEVPEKGNYQIELWGAQGGSADANSIGGKGAYTSGVINLEKDEKLYVYVGENNNTVNGNCGNNTAGSFNGTKDAVCSIGGGATDVRLIGDEWDNFDSLKSRIMVAAGGGSAYYPGHGGAGGALNGIDGEGTGADSSFYAGKGATQTSYNFGVAKNYTCNPGNGYYSGQAGSGGNGGGGSSFISGYPGCNAIDAKSTSSNIVATNQPVHYSGKKFFSSFMLAGNSSMPSPNGKTETGHAGNGFAKITLVKNVIPDLSGNGNNGLDYAVEKTNEGYTTSNSSQTGYIDMGLVNYDFKDSLSFVTRVKLNNIDGYQEIMGNWENAGGGFVLTDGKIQFMQYSAETNPPNYYNSGVSKTIIETNKWYTVVGTYDGSKIKLYINGNEENSGNMSGKVKPSPNPFLIGGNPNGTPGNLIIPNKTYTTFSDVLVFDRALTAEEISKNYREVPNPVNKDDLLLWYRFN